MIEHLYRINWVARFADLYADFTNGPAIDLCTVDSGRLSLGDLRRELRRSGVESWSWELTDDKAIIFRVKLGQATRARFVLLRLGVVVAVWTGEYDS